MVLRSPRARRRWLWWSARQLDVAGNVDPPHGRWPLNDMAPEKFSVRVVCFRVVDVRARRRPAHARSCWRRLVIAAARLRHGDLDGNLLALRVDVLVSVAQRPCRVDRVVAAQRAVRRKVVAAATDGARGLYRHDALDRDILDVVRAPRLRALIFYVVVGFAVRASQAFLLGQRELLYAVCRLVA